MIGCVCICVGIQQYVSVSILAVQRVLLIWPIEVHIMGTIYLATILYDEVSSLFNQGR